VRIIGGRWRRTPLAVPAIAGLRPTPDRVRETLFNWLTHLLPSFDEVRGLDLFAGTGALGFELASRGARSVALVESHPAALAQLRATRAKLDATQVEVIAGDGMAVIGRWPAASFDLVMLDPPFDSNLGPGALVAARRVLAEGGLIYYEAAAPLAPDAVDEVGLAVVRSGVAGRVAFHLLGRAAA